MSYGKPVGIRRPWAWDCPTLFQADKVTLSAQLPGTIEEMIASEPGQWNNARLTVAVPVAWLDVVFELWVRVGKAWLVLHRATPRLSSPVTSGGIVSATLFHHCGYPCDQWSVRARATGVELGNAELSLSCWGTEVCDDTIPSNDIRVNDGVPFSQLVAVDRPAHVRMVTMTLDPLAAAPDPQFVHLFDSDVLPVALQVPRVNGISILAGGIASFAPPGGMDFLVGVTLGLSTNYAAFDLSADEFTANVFFDG